MATLNNTKPKDTFESLLKLESNGMSSGSALKTVEAGNGDSTALELSDDDAKVNGTLNVTGATDLDSTLNVDGTVTLTSVASDSSETSALFINNSNQVVKRDLASNAFSSSVVNSFETITVGSNSVVADSSTDTLTIVAGSGVNIVATPGTDTITISATQDDVSSKPKVVLMSDGDKALITSGDKFTFAAVNNTTNLSSKTVNATSTFSVSTTNKELTVDTAVVVDITVCIIFQMTAGSASHADVAVELYQKDSGGSPVLVHSISKRVTDFSSDFQQALNFKTTRKAAANSVIYAEIKCSQIGTSGVSGNIVGGSSITVEQV